MFYFKPTKKKFRNRLEAKVALGSGRFNRLNRENIDLFYSNDSLADYEYFYENPIINTRDKQ